MAAQIKLVSSSGMKAFDLYANESSEKAKQPFEKFMSGDQWENEEMIYRRMVSDNGVGMSEELDLKKSETLGLCLVTMLVERQLEGGVEFNREGGTKCLIRFKRPIYEPRI